MMTVRVGDWARPLGGSESEWLRVTRIEGEEIWVQGEVDEINLGHIGGQFEFKANDPRTKFGRTKRLDEPHTKFGQEIEIRVEILIDLNTTGVERLTRLRLSLDRIREEILSTIAREAVKVAQVGDSHA